MDSDLGSMFLYCQWIDCGNLRQYTIQYTFLALPLCQYVVVYVLLYGSSDHSLYAFEFIKQNA